MSSTERRTQEGPPRSLRAACILAVLVLGAGAWAALRYVDDLRSPYSYMGDARAHVWWTYRWVDPELFPDDPAWRFFSLPLFAPLGYQAVYRLLVPVVDPQVLSEVLPIPLLALTAAAFFAACRRWCGGRWLGPALATTILIVSFGRWCRGGLPRSFGLPVVAVFIWLSTSKRVWPLGVGLLVAVLFYPPPVVVLGLGTLAVVGWRWHKGQAAVGDVAAYVGITLAAMALFLGCYKFSKPDWIGERPTREQQRTMAEFRHSPEGTGRNAMFGADPREFYVESDRTGIGRKTPRLIAWLILCAGVMAVRRFRDPVPPVLTGLLAGSAGMYGAALALMPMLFYPNRHVKYTVPIAALGVVAVTTDIVASSAGRRWPRIDALARRYWWLAIPVIVYFIGESAAEGIRDAREKAPPSRSLVELIEFCRSTPKDTLFAGDPYQVNSIPFLARRSVLAGDETTLCQYLGYYELMLGRLQDELRLLYATTWDEAVALAGKYGVDYVVVPRNLLDPGRPYYRPPSNRLEKELRDRARAEGAALLDPPPGARVLRLDWWDVVRVSPAAAP